jgi:hypothetical protein
MGRTKTLRHNVWLRLNELERALISYYAERYAKDSTSIIRGMLKQYIRADQNFDPKDFRRYLKERVLPELADEAERKEELGQQAEDFLKT